MKKDSSTSNVVFIIFLIVGFFLALLAFSPLPSQSFSWKKFWGSTGLEKEEEARRELIARRKKTTARKIQERMEALKSQHEALMENWKINEANAREKTEALNNSVRDLIAKILQENQKDTTKILERYQDLEEQRKILMENRLQSQQALLEGFSQMDDQLKIPLDDLLSDLENQELLNKRQRIENQRENLSLIWQALVKNSQTQSADLEAQLKTVLEDISSGTESNPQKIQERFQDLEHQRSVVLENTRAAHNRVMESAHFWDGQLSWFVNQLVEGKVETLKKSQQKNQDQTTQFENHFKNLLDPQDLRDRQSETARIMEEQRARAVEQTRIQQDRQKDLKNSADAQMRDMRDKIQDRTNGL